jgi:hypothetical protein
MAALDTIADVESAINQGGTSRMTSQGFREAALCLPESTESAHMEHPDFRVRGKIFATLGYPDESWGMVKLTPEQQASMSRLEPRAFVPVKGAWGQRGATSVRLASVSEPALRTALALAWRNVAPKRLLKQVDDANSE